VLLDRDTPTLPTGSSAPSCCRATAHWRVGPGASARRYLRRLGVMA